MKKVLIITIVLFLAISFFTGCKNEYPPSIWDPEQEYKPNPVITSVEPVDGTFAVIGEVTIKGENFSAVKEENHVYFGGKKTTTLSATETELIVLAPDIAGDSLEIKLRVDGAILFAVYYPYKLQLAAIEYGGIDEYSDAYGIACDTDENIYVSLGSKKIIQITPEEEQIDYVPVTDGFYPAMKMGPGGYLYAGRTKFIYLVPPGGGSIDKFTSKLPQKVNGFDFDLDGNIFIAAKNAIFCVKPDASYETAIDFPSITLNSLRVFNGYVYVAGEYTGTESGVVRKGIWRNKLISSDGDLDSTELVFDWGGYAGEYGPDILAITFAEDGDMYIGADEEDAITVLHPNGDGNYLNGMIEPLYPGLLNPPSTVFCWGNGQYLYVNRKSSEPSEQRLIRVTMGKNGAPYYGRQ